MIDSLTARSYYDALDNSTGAERERLENELRAYADQEEANERERANEHFEKLYTDPAYFEALSSSPEIEEAERYSIKKNEVRYEVANRAFLDYVTGKSLDDTEYYAQRDSYAHSNFGKPEIGEKEFYDLVKGQFEWEQKKRTAGNELYISAVKDALEGALSGQRKSLVDTFAKWKEKNADLVDEEKDFETLKAAMSVLAKTGDDLQEAAPMAARVWDSLTKFTQGQGDDGDLQALGSELARLRPEQRKKIYEYAVLASQASGDFDLNEIEQFSKNLGQSIARGLGFLEGPIRFRNVGGLVSLPMLSYEPINLIEANARVRRMQLAREPDSPEKTLELERLRQTEEMTRVVRELREVAKTGIDPIKPVFPEGKLSQTIERGVYGLAGSLGYMAAAGINPMLGVAAISSDEYDNLRTAYPDMDPNVAGAAAVISGSIQGFIERLQVNTLTGKFPLTGIFLRDMQTGIKRSALNFAAGLTEQNIQEGIQDAVSAGIPAFLSQVREDMPDANLDEVMKQYLDQRAEVFFAVLPLGLIAGSAATVQDFRDAGLSLKELKQFGFSKKQSETILQSDDPSAAIRTEAPERTQANIQAGIKDILADAKRAETLQRNAELPTLESALLPDGSREFRVIRPAPVVQQESAAKLTEKELSGKTVTVANVQMDAAEAHVNTTRKLKAYSALINCISK